MPLSSGLERFRMTTGLTPALAQRGGAGAVIPPVAPTPEVNPNKAPTAKTAPSIAGTARVGNELTATAGTYDGVPAPTIGGGWQRDGALISGATAIKYALVDADVGANIAYRETATNSEGNASQTSNSIGPVQSVPARMAAPALTAGDKQITVARAAAPANGGSAITSYDLRYGTDGATWTTVANIAASQVVAGLTNGTAYLVQTRAVNAVGAGDWSDSATATPVAAVTAFTDDFTGDGNLEARNGWTLAFGQAPAATTTNGILNATRTSPESGYFAPDTGSVNHYAQATLAAVGTNGPLLCVDVTDADNWVGVRNSASGYAILKKVAGTVTVIGGPSVTPAVGDLVRLELRGRDLTLMINGGSTYTASLAAGELATETRPGIVLRTSTRSPWIDNWKSEKL